MAIKKLSFRIVGESSLLPHNGQLADPSNYWVLRLKEYTSKRKKVDSDYVEMAHLEFHGGLYLTNNEPCIPGYVFEAAIIGKGGAARKERMGKEAAVAVWCVDNFPLEYEGPHDPEEMWKLFAEDGNEQFVFQALVKVGPSRIMRTRPIFREWAAHIVLEHDDEFIDEEIVKRWVEIAGRQVGLCDWRPKFGRFTVEW